MSKKLRDILGYVIAFGVAFFISTNVLFSYQVNGSSMFPTLKDGDRGFALRTNLNLRKIERFNIVVVEIENRFIVKRVIGLPGEKIEYRDNKLYVNDEYIEESFLEDTVTGDLSITVEDGSYYCLGDNRSNSADSRVYGSFEKENIKAILF